MGKTSFLLIIGVVVFLVGCNQDGTISSDPTPYTQVSIIMEDDPAMDDDSDMGDDSETGVTAESTEFEEAMDELPIVIMEMRDDMPEEPKVISQGIFMKGRYDVGGEAKLIESDGKRMLRFENFETRNGPDLRIYLSTDTSDEDFIELSKLKATNGNVNYDVPESLDLETYNHVLIWCKPFRVLFSYAELKS